MIHSNKRKLNLLLLLAVCVFISVAATKPSAGSRPAASVSQKDTIFKNLKVLPKDISKDSLDKLMHVYTKALGVKCNFCHEMKDGHPDFASDAKPEKDVARYMIHMTGELNAKYFNMENSTRPDTLSVIKCITCHHGSPHPDEAAQAVPGNMPPPPPPGDSTHKTPPPPPPAQAPNQK